jgi:Alkylmercury lyase
VFAMCAIDALGIAAMLGRDVRITSADPLDQRPVTVDVAAAGQVRWSPASSVVYAGRRAACDLCPPTPEPARAQAPPLRQRHAAATSTSSPAPPAPAPGPSVIPPGGRPGPGPAGGPGAGSGHLRSPAHHHGPSWPSGGIGAGASRNLRQATVTIPLGLRGGSSAHRRTAFDQGVLYGALAPAKLAPRRTRAPITAGTSSRSGDSFTRSPWGAWPGRGAPRATRGSASRPHLEPRTIRRPARAPARRSRRRPPSSRRSGPWSPRTGRR